MKRGGKVREQKAGARTRSSAKDYVSSHADLRPPKSCLGHFLTSSRRRRRRRQFPRQHNSDTDTMGDAEVTASSWRAVEVGRVAFFGSGPYTARVAAIVQIIDHKRVRLHDPHEQNFRQ